MNNKIIFWDFDGTLAYHSYSWSEVLILSTKKVSNIDLDKKSVAPYLSNSFPWHKYDVGHENIKDANEWWKNLSENAFYPCLKSFNLSNIEIKSICNEIRNIYTDSSLYILYTDSKNTLEYFKDRGWKNYILSNHTPELEKIINCLYIKEYINGVFSSAKIGYEKPNKKIFEYALNNTPKSNKIWMVGDNYYADVLGAQALGINTVLVHNSCNGKLINLKDLSQIIF